MTDHITRLSAACFTGCRPPSQVYPAAASAQHSDLIRAAPLGTPRKAADSAHEDSAGASKSRLRASPRPRAREPFILLRSCFANDPPNCLTLPARECGCAAACSLHLAVAGIVLLPLPFTYSTALAWRAMTIAKSRRSKIGCGNTESWIRDTYRDPHLADLS